MRIWLQARQHTLTLRGNLRFPQIAFTDGELQFSLHEVLKVPPISQRGILAEISDRCASADQLRNAENRPPSLL
jgi:hypothetical protein